MSTNPFQQFISGLFGNISGTSAAKAKTTPSSFSSPSPLLGSQKTGQAGFRGADATYMNRGDAMNSLASKKGVPFKPGNAQGFGGMSVMPNSTSMSTGKSAASGVGIVNPQASPGYAPMMTPASNVKPPQSTASRTPSTTGYTAPASGGFGSMSVAPPAPAQAPASSSGQSSGWSGNTGGGSTMGGGKSDYRSKYVEMLSGLYDPDQLKSSQDSLNTIRKRAADAQLGERKEERRIRENDVGQGLRSYNGQLTENSRKSSAELADLAIAANPFEQYITQAQGAARDMYGVGKDEDTMNYNRGRDVVGDQRNAQSDALAERKFNEDVRQFGMRYALDQQQESRMASTAARETKTTKQDYISEFVSAFSPGKTMADGTPTVDQNGLINPKAFKAAANEATQYGISRKEFIEMFGSQLYADPKTGLPDAQYGLTAVEKKLITDAVK